MSLVFLVHPGQGGKHGFCVEQEVRVEGAESSESSSIGVNEESSVSLSSSCSSKEEEEVEVQSKLREKEDGDSPLGSLDSLEESLPIKRGLSNFYSGKSKSFQSLSEAAAVTAAASDLAKPENPFNKKRRILMACKSSWRRRASCTSLVNTSSLSALHSLEENQREEEEEEEEEENEEENGRGKPFKLLVAPLPPLDRRGVKTFRSPRCFSLCDLQQHAN